MQRGMFNVKIVINTIEQQQAKIKDEEILQKLELVKQFIIYTSNYYENLISTIIEESNQAGYEFSSGLTEELEATQQIESTVNFYTSSNDEVN